MRSVVPRVTVTFGGALCPTRAVAPLVFAQAMAGTISATPTATPAKRPRVDRVSRLSRCINPPSYEMWPTPTEIEARWRAEDPHRVTCRNATRECSHTLPVRARRDPGASPTVGPRRGVTRRRPARRRGRSGPDLEGGDDRRRLQPGRRRYATSPPTSGPVGEGCRLLSRLARKGSADVPRSRLRGFLRLLRGALLLHAPPRFLRRSASSVTCPPWSGPFQSAGQSGFSCTAPDPASRARNR